MSTGNYGLSGRSPDINLRLISALYRIRGGILPVTLENFYVVAQIAAALAVISSLIFVGLQIRGNTRE